MSQFLLHQLCSKLLIKCQLDPLDVVAQLDSWAQFQVHALLHCREVEQEQRLSVNFLQTHTFLSNAVSIYKIVLFF